jgi:hypothetical protein
MNEKLFDSAIVSNLQEVVDFIGNIQKSRMVVALILWQLS